MIQTNQLKIWDFKERQIVSAEIAQEILPEADFKRGAGWGLIGTIKVYCHSGSHREGPGWQIHSFGGLR